MGSITTGREGSLWGSRTLWGLRLGIWVHDRVCAWMFLTGRGKIPAVSRKSRVEPMNVSYSTTQLSVA